MAHSWQTPCCMPRVQGQGRHSRLHQQQLCLLQLLLPVLLSLLPLLVSCCCLHVSAAHETEEELQFLQWLHDKGAREVLPGWSKLRILRPDLEGNRKGERGMQATVDMAAGETVVTIPFNASLVLDEQQDREPFPDAGLHCTFVAKLLREMEKGDKSPLYPFLRILPTQLPIPWLSMEEEDYSQLQLPPTVRRLRTLLQYFADAYQRSSPAVLGHASFKDFLWGFAMYFTRHFSLRLPVTAEHEEPQRLTMLLPFGDLLNHRFRGEWDEGDVEWEEESFTDRVELKALRPIFEGQEVFEVYLAGPNEVYFLFQGFIPEPNPHNSVVLFESPEEAVLWMLQHLNATHGFPPSINDPFLFTRAMRAARSASIHAMTEVDEYWEEDTHSGVDWFEGSSALGDCESCLEVRLRWEGSRRLLAILAAVFAEVKSAKWFRSCTEREDKVLAESAAVFHAHVAVVARCQQVLAALPTTIEEDNKLLEELDASENDKCDEHTCKWKGGFTGMRLETLKLAVKFRMIQKRLLKSIISEWSLTGPGKPKQRSTMGSHKV